MKISEIIEQLKNQKVEPTRPAVSTTAEWEKAKDYLDSWTADFEKVLRENKDKVSMYRSGKYNRIDLRMGNINTHDVELVVYEPIQEGEAKAHYVMFNNQLNRVYKRDLL